MTGMPLGVVAQRRRARGEEAALPAPSRLEQIAALRSFIAECANAGVTRNALVLRLDRLPRSLAKPHHRRLACAALEPLLEADRIRRFDLPDRVVLAWRNDAEREVAAVGRALATLLEGIEGVDPASLCERARIPDDVACLFAGGDAVLRPKPVRRVPADAEKSAAAPIDEAGVRHIERLLASADMSRFLRRADVCRISRAGRLVRAWEERSVAVEEVIGDLCPGRTSRGADAALLRRLTRFLSERMLFSLADAAELHANGPLELCLPLEIIGSAAFRRFDAEVPAGLRGDIVLTVSPDEVVTEAARFRHVRETVRERRYRLGLRADTVQVLRAFPAAPLGLDCVRLAWSVALHEQGGLPSPPNATVLFGVDRDDALAWGTARRVQYFQGRLARDGMTAG